MVSIKKMRLRLEEVKNELEMDLNRIIQQNKELEEISEELLGENYQMRLLNRLLSRNLLPQLPEE